MHNLDSAKAQKPHGRTLRSLELRVKHERPLSTHIPAGGLLMRLQHEDGGIRGVKASLVYSARQATPYEG